MKIEQTGEYEQMLEEVAREHKEILVIVEQIINRFLNNPNDTRLGIHALKKRMKGKWAIEVTDNIRIVFEWTGKTTARFLAIGTHKRVYSKKKKN